MPRLTPPERFDRKYVKTPGGCWLWTGSIHSEGYGLFTLNGRTTLAHRYSWQRFVGPIPEGLVIDHLCRVRACVNPRHLEPVTQRVNLLRGDTFQARNAAKTHCKRGHVFDEANTYHYVGRKGPERGCRTCRTEQMRRQRARQKGAA